MSSRANAQHRNATRETWAATLPPNVMLKFVLGNPCLLAPADRMRPKHDCVPTSLDKTGDPKTIEKEQGLQQVIDAEQAAYGDILQLNLTDTYG